MANKAQSRRSNRHKNKYAAQFGVTTRNKSNAKLRIQRRKKANPQSQETKRQITMRSKRHVRRQAMKAAGLPKPWTLERQLNPNPKSARKKQVTLPTIAEAMAA